MVEETERTESDWNETKNTSRVAAVLLFSLVTE